MRGRTRPRRAQWAALATSHERMTAQLQASNSTNPPAGLASTKEQPASGRNSTNPPAELAPAKEDEAAGGSNSTKTNPPAELDPAKEEAAGGSNSTNPPAELASTKEEPASGSNYSANPPAELAWAKDEEPAGGDESRTRGGATATPKNNTEETDGASSGGINNPEMEVTNVNEEPNSAFGGRTRVAVPSDPEVDSDGTGSTTSWHTCTSPVFLHETENICSSPVFASKPKVPAKPPPPTGTPSARVGSVKPPLPPTRSQVKLLEQRKKRHQRAVAAAALRGAMSAEEAQAFIRENYAMIVLRNWARRCVQEKREKVEMLRKQLETQTKPETCCGPKYRHHAADRALEELQKKPLYSFSEWYSNRSPVKRRGSRSGERRTRQARNPMHETGVSVGEVANAGRLARTM